jgi:hypothetical protein
MRDDSMVQVSYGPKNETVSPGTTVADAARKVGLKWGFLTRNRPQAFVDGRQVDNWNTVLNAGQRIEFTKPTGEKG